MASIKAGLAASAFHTGKSAVASLPKHKKHHTSLLLSALLASALFSGPVSADSSPQSITMDTAYVMPLISVNTDKARHDTALLESTAKTLEDRVHMQRVGLNTNPDQQAQYNTQLIQTYTALARDMAESGQHTKAVEAFDQALNLQSTELGIHNPVQLPLLREQLPLLEKLARWAEYNDNVYRIVSISNRNYLPGSDNRLGALGDFNRG